MAGRSLGPAREAHSQMGSGRFCVSVNVYLLVFSTFPGDYENQLFPSRKSPSSLILWPFGRVVLALSVSILVLFFSYLPT